MSPKATLESYSKIFNALENRALRNTDFIGELAVSESVLEDLRVLEREEITTGSYRVKNKDGEVFLKDLDDIDHSFIDNNNKLEVDITAKHQAGNFVIFDNWGSLLSYEELIIDPVPNIFFTESSQLLTPESSDLKYNNYIRVQKLVDFIKGLSRATGGSDSTIFYQRPLSFEFKINEKTLDYSVDLEALNKLVSKDLHKEAITYLMCKELVVFLKNIPQRKRFVHLVEHASLLVSNVLLSYQNYVDNYSFDKVRKEYVEKKTEYIRKIHNIFDSIATKLLSLPAGIWFATTQIEQVPVGGLDTIEFAKNLAVFITVIVLSLLLIANIVGHFSVLTVLKNEYSQIFNSLATSHEDDAFKINAAKDEIDSAGFQVEVKLWMSILASISITILTTWLFCTAYN